MDHSYFTTRNKKLDHSYFCVAKKTPTVVLRKAQLIREQKGLKQLPVDKDHSYHKRFPCIPSPASSVSKKFIKKIQHNAGVKNSLKYSHHKFNKLKKKKVHCQSSDDMCIIKDGDLNLDDKDASIQFEHSYYNRCQLPKADARNCDTRPILSNLNEDCDDDDDDEKDNPSKDSNFYFMHDHAYISLKLFSDVHLNRDEVCL